MAGSSAGAGAACAPGYAPCLPQVADLDCGQIPEAKRPVRVRGDDAYALDRDGDGLGCDVAGSTVGSRSPWALIIRQSPRKQALTVRVGQRVLLAGWSPRAFAGRLFQLCVAGRSPVTCGAGRTKLTGTVQTFGTHTVRAQDVRAGRFR